MAEKGFIFVEEIEFEASIRFRFISVLCTLIWALVYYVSIEAVGVSVLPLHRINSRIT